MLAKIDWIKIKNEYINTNISQRSLAEKYKVPYQTIRDKAIKEKWFDKKKEQRSKIGAKMEQKTAEKIIEAGANILVSGSSVFNGEPMENVEYFLKVLKKHEGRFHSKV